MNENAKRVRKRKRIVYDPIDPKGFSAGYRHYFSDTL